MGRKKSYDRASLIDTAMALFRAHGFTGTSTAMLVEHLGVNRNSMYAEFGSKQGLFDAVVGAYETSVLTGHFGPLEAEGSGLEEVRALFRRLAAAAAGPARGTGCLLCNTAIELGGTAAPSERLFMPKYLERIRGAIAGALENARRRGELRGGVEVDIEASYLSASVLGMFVLIRAAASPVHIEATAEGACRHLDALAAAPAE